MNEKEADALRVSFDFCTVYSHEFLYSGIRDGHVEASLRCGGLVISRHKEGVYRHLNGFR